MTHPRQLQRQMIEAADLLIRAGARVQAAHRALIDNQPGYPTQTIPDSIVTGGDPPDPTRHFGDPAARALTRMEDEPRRVLEAARTLYDVIAAWSAGNQPTDAHHLANPAELSCWSCARIRRHSPPHTDQPTDVGGRLKARHLLCRWCWDQVREVDRLPTEGEVEMHHRGQRVRRHGDEAA